MTRSALGYALAMYLVGILALCALALAVSGCAGGLSASPSVGAQQMVYSAENDFAAALRIAVAYENLPPCPASGQVCADPAIVAKVTAAAKAARASLQLAETAAQSTNNEQALVAAAAEAQADVAAFTALAKSLGVK